MRHFPGNFRHCDCKFQLGMVVKLSRVRDWPRFEYFSTSFLERVRKSHLRLFSVWSVKHVSLVQVQPKISGEIRVVSDVMRGWRCLQRRRAALSQIIVPSRLMTRIRGVKIVKSLTNPLTSFFSKSKLRKCERSELFQLNFRAQQYRIRLVRTWLVRTQLVRSRLVRSRLVRTRLVRLQLVRNTISATTISAKN